MRILATGTTVRQAAVSKKAPRIDWCPVLDVTLEALAPAQVDRRPVEVGEDISDYDGVWVSFLAPSSVGAVFTPGCLWAMYAAWTRQIPLVVYFDDWQTHGIVGGMNVVATRGRNRLFATYRNGSSMFRGDLGLRDKHAEELIAIAKLFVDGKSEFWEHAVLGLSLFDGWGDETKITNAIGPIPNVVRWDVTPLFLERFSPDEGIAVNQREAWMLAGLSDNHLNWAKKQGLTWPVDSYGPGKLATGGVLKNEEEVYHEYRRHAGMLVPKYPNSGSGWFRPRWLTGGFAGAAALCDGEDARAIGGPYQIGAHAIETMSSDERQRLAEDQIGWFMTLVQTDPEVTRSRIRGAFNVDSPEGVF